MEFYTVQDAEMNQFYQLPKVLIHDEKYKDLNASAKLAYAILRDRHSLSLKNSWIDEANRVYFIFTDKDLAEILDTSTRTANKIKNNLQQHGLLHMERQGLKKPNILYLIKPKATPDKDRKKSSNPDRKKTSYQDRKKTSTKLINNNNTDFKEEEEEIKSSENNNFQKLERILQAKKIKQSLIEKTISELVKRNIIDFNLSDIESQLEHMTTKKAKGEKIYNFAAYFANGLQESLGQSNLNEIYQKEYAPKENNRDTSFYYDWLNA